MPTGSYSLTHPQPVKTINNRPVIENSKMEYVDNSTEGRSNPWKGAWAEKAVPMQNINQKSSSIDDIISELALIEDQARYQLDKTENILSRLTGFGGADSDVSDNLEKTDEASPYAGKIGTIRDYLKRIQYKLDLAAKNHLTIESWV